MNATEFPISKVEKENSMKTPVKSKVEGGGRKEKNPNQNIQHETCDTLLNNYCTISSFPSICFVKQLYIIHLIIHF